MKYFPVFLDLRKKKCVVVGGGQVAERKVLSLLKAGALVTVVSPQMTPVLRALKEKGKIRQRSRRFRSGDLNSAYLAISATDHREINERVFREASASRIPVNVVDNPALASFITPSLISRGDILLAISTGGESPSLAKALRKKLEKEIGPEYTQLLRILGAVRKKVMLLGGGAKQNQRIFRLMMQKDLPGLIRKRKMPAVNSHLERILGPGFSLSVPGIRT